MQICGITCCGRSNFEQHCSCKKHLRKAAIAAAAAAAADGTGGPIFEAGTFSESESQTQAPLAGLQEQCRSYCKQARLRLVLSSGYNVWVTAGLQERCRSNCKQVRLCLAWKATLLPPPQDQPVVQLDDVTIAQPSACVPAERCLAMLQLPQAPTSREYAESVWDILVS